MAKKPVARHKRTSKKGKIFFAGKGSPKERFSVIFHPYGKRYFVKDNTTGRLVMTTKHKSMVDRYIEDPDKLFADKAAAHMKEVWETKKDDRPIRPRQDDWNNKRKKA